MLKISKQYLDLHQSYDQLTENSKKQMAYLQQDTVNFAEGRPFVSLTFQCASRYCFEIFSIFSSYICPTLTEKFWTLLNQCVSGLP